MLKISNIDAFYGETQILFDVSLSVGQGEVVSLVGRNGVGKTTTIRSILNLADVNKGTIQFREQEITGQQTQEIAKKGLGYIPEERDIFAGLSVRENLEMAATAYSDDETERRIEEATARFPKLRELYDSKGGHLSGGEQQMLAIARALIGDNEMLLIDEPTEGLAPRIAEDVREAIAELKGDKTILLIEQSTKLVYDLSDRIYGMVDGEIVYEGTPEDAQATGEVKELLTVQ